MPHKAKLTWTGEGLAFDAVSGSGFTVKVGTTSDGKPIGPGPKELVAMGLAGCGGTNLVTLMKKMRQNVERIEIGVEAQQADVDPMVFIHVVVRYKLYGKAIDAAKVKKALDLIEEKYCGVLHMVNKTAKTEYAFEIIEV